MAVGSLYYRRNTPGNVLIKSGHGVLQRIVIGFSGFGGVDLMVKDGLDSSGTLITLIKLDRSHPDTSLEYNVTFTNGLYIQALGLMFDITIVYD